MKYNSFEEPPKAIVEIRNNSPNQNKSDRFDNTAEKSVDSKDKKSIKNAKPKSKIYKYFLEKSIKKTDSSIPSEANSECAKSEIVGRTSPDFILIHNTLSQDLILEEKTIKSHYACCSNCIIV